eukprot:6620725-Pyramimonas_sp.AAC.1
MQGKGQSKPLVGGTNWTACTVRLSKRNLVVISIYLQPGAGYNSLNAKVVRECTVFLKQRELPFVV